MLNQTLQQVSMQHLLEELQSIRKVLHTQIKNDWPDKKLPSLPEVPQTSTENIPTRWQSLCYLFGLSVFEKNLLLLCIGQELATDFPALFAHAIGNKRAGYPTLELALRLFEGPSNYLLPESPLRRWQLIELSIGQSLVRSPLKITERILHYLLGLSTLAPEIRAWVRPQTLMPEPLASYQIKAEQLFSLWETDAPPLAQLIGASYEQAEQIVAWLAKDTGRLVLTLDLQNLPYSHNQQINQLLLQREILLEHYIVLINATSYHDMQLTPERKQQLHTFLNSIESAFASSIIIYTPQPLSSLSVSTQVIPLVPLTMSEQLTLWQTYLPTEECVTVEELNTLCQQFTLSPRQIAAVSQQYQLESKPEIESLWHLCRQQLSQHYSDKIRVIDTRMQWNDLVLDEKTQALLKEIINQIKYRYRVYQQLGFAKYRQRGLGIAALFTGPSGTGKTTAAEILAHELQLTLLHVDLSGLVSKYIGETEKNLRDIFQQAQKSGAILLFDEADALFGKRSNQLQSSNDRHSNMEISYLLQLMEAYQGLSILTSNLQANMDTAFIRRFRFIVPFSLPTPAQRLTIWQHAFPKEAAVAELDWAKLAELDLSGANIHTAVMNAAFVAVAEGKPIDMQHLLAAINYEFTKLGKLISHLS